MLNNGILKWHGGLIVLAIWFVQLIESGGSRQVISD